MKTPYATGPGGRRVALVEEHRRRLPEKQPAMGALYGIRWLVCRRRREWCRFGLSDPTRSSLSNQRLRRSFLCLAVSRPALLRSFPDRLQPGPSTSSASWTLPVRLASPASFVLPPRLSTSRCPRAVRPVDVLRERYERLQRRHGKASVEELLAIADRAAAHVKRPYVDHAELLYDEHGLPK
jgi:Rv0623-like transcription factor